MMLKIKETTYYKVKKGQTLRMLADTFRVSEFLLAKENRLTQALQVGQVVKIPNERGNIYFVQEGDTKTLLSGGAMQYEKRNGTDVFYIGMRIIL